MLVLLLSHFPPTKLRRFLKPCKSFRVFFHFILFPRALCVPLPRALYPVSPFIMYLSPVHYSLRLSGIVDPFRLARLVVLVPLGSFSRSGSLFLWFAWLVWFAWFPLSNTKTTRRQDENDTKTRRRRHGIGARQQAETIPL